MSAGVKVSPSQNKPLLSVWRRERILDGKVIEEEIVHETENLVETILQERNSTTTIPEATKLTKSSPAAKNSTKSNPAAKNSTTSILPATNPTTSAKISVVKNLAKILEAKKSTKKTAEHEKSAKVVSEKKSNESGNKVNGDPPKRRGGRPKSINICPYNGCGKVFKKPSRLLWHTRLHTGEKPYACSWENCTKAYRTTSHLKRHEETHNVVEERLICRHCRMTFKNRQNLIRHCFRRHDADNKLYCEDCGRVFRKKKNLEYHLASHQDVKYSCDKCQKTFDDGLKYRRHINLIHLLKYSCSFNNCDAKFEKFLEYKAHCRDHEEEGLSEEKRLLQRKLKRKSRSRLVTCPYENCSRIYYYQSNLNHHIRVIHQGIKKYECDICKKKYTLKKPLKFHMENVHNIDCGLKKKKDDDIQIKEIIYDQIKIEEFKMEDVEDVKKQRKKRSDAGKPRKAPVVDTTDVKQQ